MIILSDEMQRALERQPNTQTAVLDMIQFPDLIAGQSVVTIDEHRYGVLRYDRGYNPRTATAQLILLDAEVVGK